MLQVTLMCYVHYHMARPVTSSSEASTHDAYSSIMCITCAQQSLHLYGEYPSLKKRKGMICITCAQHLSSSKSRCSANEVSLAAVLCPYQAHHAQQVLTHCCAGSRHRLPSRPECSTGTGTGWSAWPPKPPAWQCRGPARGPAGASCARAEPGRGILAGTPGGPCTHGHLLSCHSWHLNSFT